MAKRFYCCPITEGLLHLDRSEAHHMSSVRRLEKGDIVELFDGCGCQGFARIVEASSRRALVEVESIRMLYPRACGRVFLAVSVAKGERFDWLISKCTELGVDGILPTIYERTVKLARGQKVQDRYRKLAIAAAKQSGNIFLPEIAEARGFLEVVQGVRERYRAIEMIVGCPDRAGRPLAEMSFSGMDVVAFVGPEGGFSQDELSWLLESGAKQVRLTDTILRVETAGVAMAAILASQRDAIITTD